MWIKAKDFQRFLDDVEHGDFSNLETYKLIIADAIKAEKTATKKAFLKRVEFYDLIYEELKNAKYTGLSPTDFQFLLADKYGKRYSCSKISAALNSMANTSWMCHLATEADCPEYKEKYRVRREQNAKYPITKFYIY